MDTEHNIEYVGFWARTAASIIDSILIFVVITPLLLAIYGTDYFLDGSTDLVRGPADLLVSYVLPAVAVIMFWCLRNSTPGKMAVDAAIVDARTGQAPSTGQYVGRYLAYFVSTIPLCLGFIWIGLDARKQGWHDKLAGTVVVRQRRPAALPA